MELTWSLNLWKNLCLFKWQNFSLVSNFTFTWSCIGNNDLCFNMKNCININLKCLIDLALCMEFPKLVHSLTQKGKKSNWSFSFCKKIPLSCFYLQLMSDNQEHTLTSDTLCDIAKSNNLYSFWTCEFWKFSSVT